MIIKKMFFVLAAAFLLTGCYDKTETEDRQYVVLMGIDGAESYEEISEELNIHESGGEYIMSLGEAEIESDIGDEREGQRTIVISGDTASQMKRTADRYSDKRTYFGQLKAIILGKDILTDRERLEDVVYSIERAGDINTRAVIFAVDETAAKAVEGAMKDGGEGGLYLWDYYRNNISDRDDDEYTDFEKLVRCIREGRTFIIPKLTYDGSAYVMGAAIIKDGEYVGSADENDIRAVGWLKGRARGELVSVGDASFKVIKEKIKITDENGACVVDIKADCAAEGGGCEKYSDDDVERVIKENLENTINKAQKLNADFLAAETDNGDIRISVDVKFVSTGVIK